MATLTGKKIANTYLQMLQVGSGNVGLSASLQTIQDGSGANSPLQLSSSTLNINGTIQFNGVTLTATASTINTMANLSGVTGIVAVSASNVYGRTLTAGTGISISNATGTEGNPTFSLNTSGVSAGSYGPVSQFQVNTYGQVVSASIPTSVSISTIRSADFIGGTLALDSAASITGTLHVVSGITFDGNVSVGGNVLVSGGITTNNISVTSSITGNFISSPTISTTNLTANNLNFFTVSVSAFNVGGLTAVSGTFTERVSAGNYYGNGANLTNVSAAFAASATNASFAVSATNATNAVSATFASSATNASFAVSATNATNAVSATFAASATNASFAVSATNATNAVSATFAASATNASFAVSATNATNAVSATFAASATNASFAVSATNATNTVNVIGGIVSATTLSASGAATLSSTLGVTGVATLGNGAILGTPASATLTNATGLPISSGVSGLGTGVATALAVNVGSAGAPVVNGGALGTPSSGTVTNLTGTASININGTVGATTPAAVAATTGTFSNALTVTHNNYDGITSAGSSSNSISLRIQNTFAGARNWNLASSGGSVGPNGAFVVYDDSGGGSRLTIDSSGNVGIGTTSAAARFQTNSTDGTIAIFRTTSGANNGRLTVDVSDASATAGFAIGGNSSFPAMTFSNGGAERMRIDSSGNVGIGTASPGAKLDINAGGTTKIYIGANTSNANYNAISLNSNNADSARIGMTGGGSGDNALYLDANANINFRPSGSATVAVTMLSGGNVGIGTTSPNASANTTIKQGSSTYQLQLEQSNATDGYGLRCNAADGDLTFSRYASSAYTERMRLTASGNVGIGTSSPDYQLEVNTDSAGKPGVGGLWTVVSDERIKSNIVPANLDRCYEIVKSVPLKYFGFAPGVYTDDQINDKHNLGWIAQDVQKVFKNAVSVKPFTLKTDIPDGVEEYEEQDFTTETVEKTETSIQVIDGKAVQVSKVVASENKVMLFDTVDVLDEAGAAVMDGDKPLTHQMPRMITKTRTKIRHDVIEDCLDLNSGQMIAALYGCVQALMAKVEALEAASEPARTP